MRCVVSFFVTGEPFFVSDKNLPLKQNLSLSFKFLELGKFTIIPPATATHFVRLA